MAFSKYQEGNEYTRYFIKESQETGSENNWSAHERKRTQVNNCVKSAKRKYNGQLLELKAPEPKKFWKK